MIVNGLKKKYKFYEDKSNAEDREIKITSINHQNFDFYRGYLFSDKKRVPIHHKLFFKYINKSKLKEKDDLKKNKL